MKKELIVEISLLFCVHFAPRGRMRRIFYAQTALTCRIYKQFMIMVDFVSVSRRQIFLPKCRQLNL